jgi:hypothetical protein
MTTQNYLMVQNNVVTNDVLWDGNVETWAPPVGATMLVQTTTPALNWVEVLPRTNPPTFSLQEVMGEGAVGFTWNGSVLTTNQPNPSTP